MFPGSVFPAQPGCHPPRYKVRFHSDDSGWPSQVVGLWILCASLSGKYINIYLKNIYNTSLF